MNFHGMKRKQLQALCKKHGISGNLKNCEMADRLASIFKENAEPASETQISLDDSGEKDSEKDTLLEANRTKTVTFSPESEIFEFTCSVKRPRGRTGKVQSKEPTRDVPEAGNVTRRSKRNVAKDNTEGRALSIHGDEPQTKGKIKATGKKPSMPSQDGAEVRNMLRRSKRIATNDNAQDRAIGVDVSELHVVSETLAKEQPHGKSTRIGLEGGKALRQSKRVEANDITEGGSLGINISKLQREDKIQVTRKQTRRSAQVGIEGKIVFRQSNRVAANVNAQDKAAGVNETEKQDGLELENVSRWTKRAGVNADAQGGALRINVRELHAEVDAQNQVRRSTRNGPIESQVTRRSKRNAADHRAQGEALGININEQDVEGEGQAIEKQHKRSVKDSPELKKSLRRSKRFATDDDAQVGGFRTNTGEVHAKAVPCELEKKPRRYTRNGPKERQVLGQLKRIAADPITQSRIPGTNVDGGALEINFNEQHVEGEGQVIERQVQRSSKDSPELKKSLRRSKRYGTDDDAQVGALRTTIGESHTEVVACELEKQPRRSTRNGPKERQILKQSEHIAANGIAQSGIPETNVECGAPEINFNEQHVNSKRQVISKQRKRSIKNGLELQKNLRRSKRFAANDDQQSKAFGIDIDDQNKEVETQSANKKPREASKLVDENSSEVNKDERSTPVTRLPAKVAGKLKSNRSEFQTVDKEVISMPSSMALEELPTKYAELETEAGGKSNDVKSSNSKLIVQNSFKKRKGSKRKGLKKKPRRLAEGSYTFSEAETISCVARTKDPLMKKSIDVCVGPDSELLDSGPMAGENEEKDAEDNVIQAQTNGDPVKAESSSKVSMEESLVEPKHETPFVFDVSGNLSSFGRGDCNAGEQTEVETSAGHSDSVKSAPGETPTLTKELIMESIEETEVDVPKDHAVAMDADPKLMTEEPAKIKKETFVSAMDSDHDEEAVHEQLSSEDIKNNRDHWKGIYIEYDDEKIVLEKELQADSLIEVAVEGLQDKLRSKIDGYNVSAEYPSEPSSISRSVMEQTAAKVGCDRHGSKAFLSKKTMPIIASELMEERGSNEEELVVIASAEEYAGSAAIGTKGMAGKFVQEVSEFEVMKESLGLLPKVNPVENGKNEDADPSIDDQGNKNKRVQAANDSHHKGRNESAFKSRENKPAEIHNESGIFITPERNLMLGDELDEAGKTFMAESEMDHNDDDDMQLKTNTRVLGQVDEQKDEELQAFGGTDEVAEFHDESSLFTTLERNLMVGDKLDETGKMIVTETVMEYTNDAMELKEHAAIVGQADEQKAEDHPASEGLETEATEYPKESGIFTTPENNLMLGDELDEARKTVMAEPVREYTDNAIQLKASAIILGQVGEQKVEDHQVIDKLDEAGKTVTTKTVMEYAHEVIELKHNAMIIGQADEQKTEDNQASEGLENEAEDCPNESGIFITLENNLMPGFELDEARKTVITEPVMEYTDDAMELKANAIILGQVGEQKAEDHHVSKGSENEAAKFRYEFGIFTTPEKNLILKDELDEVGKTVMTGSVMEYADDAVELMINNEVNEQRPEEHGNSDKSEKHDVQKSWYFSPKIASDESDKHEVERDYSASLEKPMVESISNGPKETKYCCTPNMEMVADEDVRPKIMSGEKEAVTGDMSARCKKSEETQTEAKISDFSVASSDGKAVHYLKKNLDPCPSLTPENTAAKLHDKSPIFTSTERNLMLGDHDLDEAKEKGEMSGAEALAGCCVDAAELKANAMVIEEVNEQTTQELVGEETHHSHRASERSDLELHDESEIVTTPERNLMLEDELHKAGRTSIAESLTDYDGEAIGLKAKTVTLLDDTGNKLRISGAEAVPGHHDDAIESKANAMVTEEYEGQKTQALAGKDDIVPVLIPENAHRESLKIASVLAEAEFKINDSKETDHSHSLVVQNTCGGNGPMAEEEQVYDTNHSRQEHAQDHDCDNSCTEITEVRGCLDADNIGSDKTEYDNNVEGEAMTKPHCQQKSATLCNSEAKCSGEMEFSAGELSSQPEVGPVCCMVNPLSIPSLSEECEPPANNQELIVDAWKQQITNDDRGDNGSYEFPVVTEDISSKQSDENFQLDHSGLSNKKTKEGENSETVSGTIFQKTGEKCSNEFLDTEGIVLRTASEKSPAAFALQSDTHDSISVDKAMSSVELPVLHDNNQQDEEMIIGETNTSLEEIHVNQLDGSP